LRTPNVVDVDAADATVETEGIDVQMAVTAHVQMAETVLHVQMAETDPHVQKNLKWETHPPLANPVLNAPADEDLS
jgi:hypothetical protein